MNDNKTAFEKACEHIEEEMLKKVKGKFVEQFPQLKEYQVAIDKHYHDSIMYGRSVMRMWGSEANPMSLTKEESKIAYDIETPLFVGDRVTHSEANGNIYVVTHTYVENGLITIRATDDLGYEVYGKSKYFRKVQELPSSLLEAAALWGLKQRISPTTVSALPPGKPECECGKDKHGFAMHLTWCPKHNESI